MTDVRSTVPPSPSQADLSELRTRPNTPATSHASAYEDDDRRQLMREIFEDALIFDEGDSCREDVATYYPRALQFQPEAEERLRERYAYLQHEAGGVAEIERKVRKTFDDVPPQEYFDKHARRAEFVDDWYEIYKKTYLIDRVLDQFHPLDWGRIIPGWGWDNNPQEPWLSPSPSAAGGEDGWDKDSEEVRPFLQLHQHLHPPKLVKEQIETGLTLDNLYDEKIEKKRVRTV
jgi:hypothetical protein